MTTDEKLKAHQSNTGSAQATVPPSAPLPPPRFNPDQAEESAAGQLVPDDQIEGEPAEAARWDPSPRTKLVRVAIVALILTAIAAILYAWQLPPFGGRFEQTDNAYVRGQTTVISPQVPGYVATVAVKDFQNVEPGQVLAQIDNRIYLAKLGQARANVLTQISNLDNSTQAQRSREANELAGEAAIFSAEAQLRRVQADMRRVESLIERGWVTSRERDQQTAALRAAEASVRQARAAREINRQDVRTVIVGRAGLIANVEAARALVRLAEVDLGHTIIRAPQAGQLSEIGVRRGQYVSAGTQLMFLVPKTFWVTANFKEAQTRKMRVGQPASFKVDALGGARLDGHVESLAPAAGSEFAVLRSDNATGNFVKVAQRISVRIQIAPNQPQLSRLRPGMSVVARIDTAE